jgi:UDP-N-acetylmuramate--alanine ligase
VIDDYGHHPVEIAAVLKAGRQAVGEGKGKLIAVVQPHRYTRIHDLFDEFCTCFDEADVVLIADVYAAGEQPIEGVSKEHLVDAVKAHGHRAVEAMASPETLAEQILTLPKRGIWLFVWGLGALHTGRMICLHSWRFARTEIKSLVVIVIPAKAGIHGCRSTTA